MMGAGSEPIFANLITGKVPRKELAFYFFREDNNLDSVYVYASWDIEVLLDTRRGHDPFHLRNTNTTSFKKFICIFTTASSWAPPPPSAVKTNCDPQAQPLSSSEQVYLDSNKNLATDTSFSNSACTS